MIKHHMTPEDVADTLYKNFPEEKEEFLRQYKDGWDSWKVAEGVHMEYKGYQYRLVAQDERGHDFYEGGQGRRLLMFDAKIIELG